MVLEDQLTLAGLLALIKAVTSSVTQQRLPHAGTCIGKSNGLCLALVCGLAAYLQPAVLRVVLHLQVSKCLASSNVQKHCLTPS